MDVVKREIQLDLIAGKKTGNGKNVAELSTMTDKTIIGGLNLQGDNVLS